jgi:hypothetical protein
LPSARRLAVEVLVRCLQQAAVCSDHGSVDDVLQLLDGPGPMLVLQEFDHIIGNVTRVNSTRSLSSADGFVGL